MVCVGSSTCFWLVMGLTHIRSLEFNKPEPLVKKGLQMWIGKKPVSGKRKGRGEKDKDMKKHNPSRKGVLCRFCICFYTLNCPQGTMFFQTSSNKLSRGVFLEQKKLKCLPLVANQQVSIAETQQDSVTLKKVVG